MRPHIYTYVYIYTYVHTRIIYTYVYIYTYVHTRIYTFVYLNIFIYLNLIIRTHTPIYPVAQKIREALMFEKIKTIQHELGGC